MLVEETVHHTNCVNPGAWTLVEEIIHYTNCVNPGACALVGRDSPLHKLCKSSSNKKKAR